MQEQLKSNKKLWNKLVELHAESTFYDLESFISGRCTLKSIEKELLSNVQNKSLLHLQCHFGMDSLSWSRLGAVVTGVDFSNTAIALASDLSRNTGLEARFICCSIEELDSNLEEKFDIVFTSYGVLCWLPDLDVWAKTISNHLKEGGIFLIVEEHPLGHILEQEGEELVMKYSYFDNSPLTLEVDCSYASEKKFEKTTTYEWTHTLESTINSLIKNGLKINQLREYPFCMYKKFPCMQETKEGWWVYPKREDLPLTFSLVATK